MYKQISPQPLILLLHFIISIFCNLIVLPASYCHDDDQFVACSHSYSCGSSIKNISYPFWGNNRSEFCGRAGFELKCQDNQYSIIQPAPQIKFRVLKINSSQRVMTIARDDLWDNFCPGIFKQTTLGYAPFHCAPNKVLFTVFYDCSNKILQQQDRFISFNCSVQGREINGFYNSDEPLGVQLPNVSNICNKSVTVPILSTSVHYLQVGKLGKALNLGFNVEYHARGCQPCQSSGGICGSNHSTSKEFVCLCRDKPHAQTCPSGNGSNLKLKFFIIGIVSAGIGILAVTCMIIIFYFRPRISSIVSKILFWKARKNEDDLEAFIRNYGPLAPKRYSFSEVKKMTNLFKDKLGQGGHGGVYKGKLSDGKLVAVKLLNTSVGNGQEFINEVASTSRTSHVNVVSLLGFCLEGSNTALIYEFYPNGSLEKFIYNEDNFKARQQLGWEKLYQIVLGIARGLEYLHRGCNTKILHFDIKPHNILLDEDFYPKISDFGLAKLCTRNESTVSMLEARGTIGYIAPEVFSRKFGEVSHKSDVYSYGMMVLEIAGGRKNIDLRADYTSEIYFPHWIYKDMELGEGFKLRDAMSSEENEIAKKMILVGLWCIQTRPSDRPSINMVIDMLQGSIEALRIPPKPFLYSPPRSSSMDSYTISMS